MLPVPLLIQFIKNSNQHEERIQSCGPNGIADPAHVGIDPDLFFTDPDPDKLDPDSKTLFYNVNLIGISYMFGSGSVTYIYITAAILFVIFLLFHNTGRIRICGSGSGPIIQTIATQRDNMT